MRDKDVTSSRRGFRAVLKPREELRIKRGHPWVYDNEIAFVEGSPPPGAEVSLFDSKASFLGKGFFNPSSKIRLRLYSRTGEKADKAFF